MRRREFMATLAGAAGLPLMAHAQQKVPPVIGFLNSASPESTSTALTAFRTGLAAEGYNEGANLTIEYRWAYDQYDRLPELAADLISRRVLLIAATGGPISALTAKAATSTVPVVFTAVADPVRSGLVASLSRPGGNLTGTAGLTTELDPKRLELLHELLTGVSRVGALVNPQRPNVVLQSSELMAAAQKIGVDLTLLYAGSEDELKVVFAHVHQHSIEALLVTADPFFVSRRSTLLSLISQARIPAIYQWRELATAGGLMSYGPSRTEAYEQAGTYAGRILKGEKPADLPVLQPTKFELVINLKTAKALGLTVPAILLARADEVIE
jgi:putative tryptophan/tyrosine transport system substrate-binding protein